MVNTNLGRNDVVSGGELLSTSQPGNAGEEGGLDVVDQGNIFVA